MSSDYNSLFSEGLSYHGGIEYDAVKKRSDDIFRTEHTTSRIWDGMNWELYSRPTRRNPGETFDSGSFKEDFGKRVVIVGYGLMDAIPQEDIDDDKYGVIHQILPMQGGALGRTFAINEELISAELMMNAAYSASTGLAVQFDGVSMFSTAHPVSKARSATTVGNRPTAEADMSIAAADAGRVSLATQYAANYTERLDNEVRVVAFNPAVERVTNQVFRGKWERATGDRNDNMTLNEMNVKLIPWPYFTKSGATGTNNAWFMLGKNHGLVKVVRQAMKMQTQPDIYTNSVVWIAHARLEVAWTTWRGSYGSVGV